MKGRRRENGSLRPVRPQKHITKEATSADSENEGEVRNPFKSDAEKEPSEADSMEGIQMPPEMISEDHADEAGRGPKVKKTPRGPTK